MKKLMFLAFATFAVSAAMAFPSPKISAIQIESTKGLNARLTVNYTLSESAIVLCDIVTNVTGTAEGDDFASIGPERLLTFTGDVGHKVEAGTGRSFVWYAGADWPSNKLDEATMRVRLTAYPTNRPPDYLVVDLAKDAKERHRYYASAADIPGFPESDLYRTQKLVMRFIRTKNIPWTMGALSENRIADQRQCELPHTVRLRSNYWISVFEMTKGQYAHLADNAANQTNVMPLSNDAPFNTVRGASTLYPALPSDSSHLGKLYLRTGIRFDLPSEAQWEYAAKAGHGEHLWGDGTEMTEFNLTNGIGQAVYNGVVDTIGKLQRPGSFKPNDWGIYDMMGNVCEYCLDWWQQDISWNSEGVVNADGENYADGSAVDGTAYRVARGGYYSSDFLHIRPAYRYSAKVPPNNWIEGMGYRVVTEFGIK